MSFSSLLICDQESMNFISKLYVWSLGKPPILLTCTCLSLVDGVFTCFCPPEGLLHPACGAGSLLHLNFSIQTSI